MTEPASPSFRIVVATRNRADDLGTLLGLLAAQLEAHPNFHLVVVNDGSPGAAYDAAIAPYRQLLDYRVLAEQVGTGLARQAGFADGEEDYFITTDDDCLPEPDWLARTEALAMAHPRVDLFAGSTVPVPSVRPGVIERFIIAGKRVPYPVVEEPMGLVMAIGALTMCRRDAFEAAGGFSPEIRGAAQDWNLTYKLLKNHCRYLVPGDWTVGHRSNATLKETLLRNYGYGFGGAQHVLIERDWEGARIFGNGTVGEMARKVLAAAKVANAEARSAGCRPTEYWGQALFAALVDLCLQTGWRRGLAHYGRRYGRALPTHTRLVFADPLRRAAPARSAVAGGDARPSIRIVVATYRRPEDLATFLEAMAPQVGSRRNVKLVVVNDGSHDAAYQGVIDRFAGVIDYRPEPVNRGPSGARAAGCAGACEDYLVFTDDDCIAPAGWIDWLEALIDTYREVDMLVGTTMPVSSARPGIVERFLADTNRFPQPYLSHRHGLMVAVTAHLACKREAFEAAGGFDPTLDTSSEDWNLTTRLLDTGASYRVCDKWVIGHKGEQGLARSLRRYYHYGRGGAQNILLTQDWAAALEIHGGTGLLCIPRALSGAINLTRRSAAFQAASWPTRLVYLLLSVAIGGQFVRGWIAGLRHFSKTLGIEVPRQPVAGKKLAGFVMRPATDSSHSRG